MPVAAGSELPVCEGNKMREICACPCWIVVLAMCAAGHALIHRIFTWIGE